MDEFINFQATVDNEDENIVIDESHQWNSFIDESHLMVIHHIIIALLMSRDCYLVQKKMHSLNMMLKNS